MVWIAFVCIGLANLPRALIAPSIALDGKQTPFDYPLVVHVVVIAASVTFGIAVAIKFDAEQQLDRLQPPPFWPKSAGDWFVVALLLVWLVGALLQLVLTFLGE